MKFNKIVCVDQTRLNAGAIRELQKFSKEKVEVYSNYPKTDSEIIVRIGNAEAVIVSWHTHVGKEIIDQCPDIKYIGMACSLYDEESANVAVKYARDKNITVTGIRDYGDPGVAEFIVSELIQLLHGYKGDQWKEMPLELTNSKIGIIGLGVTGKLLANCLLPFGANLYYFSRTRKHDYEKIGVNFLELNELLSVCDIVSLHLPKKATLLSEKEFNEFGNGKVLINTSLGMPFEEAAFSEWIKKDRNFAIFDGDGRNQLSEKTLKLGGVISTGKSAGWSAQTLQRLSSKVVAKLEDYCKNS